MRVRNDAALLNNWHEEIEVLDFTSSLRESTIPRVAPIRVPSFSTSPRPPRRYELAQSPGECEASCQARPPWALVLAFWAALWLLGVAVGRKGSITRLPPLPAGGPVGGGVGAEGLCGRKQGVVTRETDGVASCCTLPNVVLLTNELEGVFLW